MTLSDVYAAAGAVAVPAADPPVRIEKADVGLRARGPARAREASVHRVTAWGQVMWADFRSAWWLPESVPTVARAWSQRLPDRERVPGDSDALYAAWVVYNHAVMLPAVAVLNLIVGVLTPLVFAVSHPARLGLLLLITIPLVVAVAAA